MDKQHVVYKNCDTLPIYNFFKILSESDLKWLIKGYDEYSDKKDYDNILDKELSDKFEDIMSEYYSLKKDEKIMANYKNLIAIKELKKKYIVFSKLIDLIKYSFLIDDLKEISDFLSRIDYKYKIDFNKEIELEKARLTRYLKGVLYKIEMKEYELNESVKKAEENINNNFKIDIFQEVSYMEQALEKNSIDPFNTPVSKWLAYDKIRTQKYERYNRLR